ncbi:hypothetical protein [Kallotenue papyrolyticum]|uniref:hypothetical protein n=1 Tax=Kallotenue papyrolyticum TaxID=1325125 RepID=UPI0004785B84|nr:hypothetical protein [Kallotenue papyrolyticum]
MRGWYFSDDGGLPEEDLRELADLLAMQLYGTLERKVYGLSKQDVAELVAPYIEDLTPEDQRSVAWLVWDLFQEALKIEMRERRRRR